MNSNEKLEWFCMVFSDMGNSDDHQFHSVLLWLLELVDESTGWRDV